MAEIAPFRGIRYDPDAVGDLARVVAPPYDVISDAGRDALEDASPHNVVRLTLGRDEPSDDERSSKYTRARALLEAWLAAGVLRADPDEALYVYEERYPLGGETKVQRGVLAALVLEDPGRGGALPHERTYDHIVDDRLALLRATAANLEPIFCVYDGGDAAASAALDRTCAAEPDAEFTTDDGVTHLVWRMTEPGSIRAVCHAAERSTLVIADGHHRHRTQMTYAAERRASEGHGPWDAELVYLVDATRWGPTLLPIHRTVSGWEPDAIIEAVRPVFRVEEAPADDPEALAAELAKRRIFSRCYALTDGARAWWLSVSDRVAEREAMPAERSAAWRDLDVAVLHTLVFTGLLGGVEPAFVHSATEAVEAVRAGQASAAFLLAPMPFEAVRAVAEAGEAMPQKSTYFVPKPRSGIVLRSLEA